ncbi:succinate semialdehyde dehydrogenase [Rahnella sp. BIGb0236]|uniref:aldehyde dehydrogenase family protein n=1 Tax=Rahnella sp. BIGb0236 TaxID=2485117 RepID=UPI00106183B4|nr:aldehyde dehydrogenase family protein [Rahnella sp. BIGb0236]TDS98101.1 succinate semialdehyde dehydrogenase [Rahnella sp. BIGb0236]
MTTASTQTHAISLNPFNGERLGEYPYDTPLALEATVAQGSNAFKHWRKTDVAQRAALLVHLAAELREASEDIARMISREMGKPVKQARAEVEKSANLCEWYAQNGPAMLAPEPTQIDNGEAHIHYRPSGMILAVMPWNFPVWQILRGAVPALLAGNTFLLKPAPNVMGTTYLVKQAALKAGFPAGAFGVINVGNAAVADLIADPRVVAVTVTGSVRAGAAIAELAGKAVKKCVLELGGSDPFIVLNDADIDAAVKAAVAGRYQNTGQVCAAAKRLIIEEGVLETFTEKFVAATQALVTGDPLDDATYIGPMARFDLRDELDKQVQDSLRGGATLLLGGEKMAGNGNFYAPTILSNVTPEMTAFRQELFGPVAAISVARNAEHAVELANDSDFGLTATIFTADLDLAEQMTGELETGGVFINGYSASDPRVAFGGVKKSGYGRELSHFGLREFCNVQTVWSNRQ